VSEIEEYYRSLRAEVDALDDDQGDGWDADLDDLESIDFFGHGWGLSDDPLEPAPISGDYDLEGEDELEGDDDDELELEGEDELEGRKIRRSASRKRRLWLKRLRRRKKFLRKRLMARRKRAKRAALKLASKMEGLALTM
jgi:hypothetical protein